MVEWSWEGGVGFGVDDPAKQVNWAGGKKWNGGAGGQKKTNRENTKNTNKKVGEKRVVEINLADRGEKEQTVEENFKSGTERQQAIVKLKKTEA